MLSCAAWSVTSPGIADGRTICAITGGSPDLPEICRGPQAERLVLDGNVSIPLSVGLDGRPSTLELYLVSDGSSRRHRVEAVARDRAATQVEYARFESRRDLTRVSGNAAGNYQPTWHPGGRYLVWRQDGTPPRLWCLDFQSRNREPVAIDLPTSESDSLFGEDRDGISTFQWHPDRIELWVRQTRSPTLRRLTLDGCRSQVADVEGLPVVDDFSIAPGGRLLTVRPPAAETLGLRTLDGDERGVLCGPGARQKVLETAICRGVHWRPDGAQLTFWRSLPGVPGSQQIVVAEIVDERLGRVVSLDLEREPQRAHQRPARPALGGRYAPDGRSLAFISDGALYVVPTDGIFGRRPVPRALSVAQGSYDGGHSAPVWLGPHHVAAVIEAVGNRHPIVVVPIEPPGRSPSLISAVFPDHYDLAYDPHSGRLALSAFDGQQGVFVRRLQTHRPATAAAIEHAVRIESPGREPEQFTTSSARARLEPTIGAAINWGAEPQGYRLDLVLTIEPEAAK